MQQSRIQMIAVDKLVVNPEYESLLPQVVGEDFEKLETSILEVHILHPFVISPDNVVLDGHTRLRICKIHDITEVPCIIRSFQTEMEEKEFVLSFNLSRRQLTALQKVELGLELLKIEMVKAKQRQIQAGAEFGVGHPKEHTQDIGDSIKTRKESESLLIAAKKVNLNSETLRKARKIQRKSEIDDRAKGLWGDVRSGKTTIHGAYALLQEQERKDEMPQTIDRKYSIVNISPLRYNCKELKKLNLRLEEDAIVWMWSSNRFLQSAFALLQFWGLQYQTMLTWVKSKKGEGSMPWLIDQTEHCLLATKGSPAIKHSSQTSVIIATPTGRHQKPREFFMFIDSLSDGERIDICSTGGEEESELE